MPMMTPSGGGFPWLEVVIPAVIALLLLIVALAKGKGTVGEW